MKSQTPTASEPPGQTSSPFDVGVRGLQPRPLTDPEGREAWQDYALGLGLARVGTASVDETSLTREAESKKRHAAWVAAGSNAALVYMAAPRRSPPELLPGARSVVVALGNTESVGPSARPSEGQVAAYARGQDYHVVLKSKLWQLAQYLCDSSGHPARARVCVDTAPILERFWAEEAGVAFIGKSTMAIAPGLGTTGLLGLLLLDIPLSPTPRLPQGCGTCTLCLDACPTDAFSAPFVLDANKCISYLTIENSGDVPEPLRSAVGTRLFGCDECQVVCPYNASRKRPGPMAEFQNRLTRRPDNAAPSLPVTAADWLTMTSGDYRRLTKGSALRRAPRAQLQRNAAVCLGNAEGETPEADVALVTALRTNPSPLVRKHAAWALMRVNPTLAENILQELCETHPDEDWTEDLRRQLEERRAPPLVAQ